MILFTQLSGKLKTSNKSLLSRERSGEQSKPPTILLRKLQVEVLEKQPPITRITKVEWSPRRLLARYR
jgi:hypothetical protein